MDGSSNAQNTLDLIRRHGIIAIMRRLPGDALLRTAEALLKGGVQLIEVAFDQNGSITDTAEAIARLAAEFSHELCLGAGTVLTYAQLSAAREAGARYIIAPDTNAEIIEATRAAGLVSIPGALTPTEISRAYALGAHMVKVFPAGQMGPGYFAAIKAPLSHIPLAAVGGVDVSDVRAYRRAGAEAFGISSRLISAEAVRCGVYGDITAKARAFSTAFTEALQ